MLDVGNGKIKSGCGIRHVQYILFVENESTNSGKRSLNRISTTNRGAPCAQEQAPQRHLPRQPLANPHPQADRIIIMPNILPVPFECFQLFLDLALGGLPLIFLLLQYFMHLSQFEQFELSNAYFEKCSELAVVEGEFGIDEIGEEMGRRDLDAEFQLLRALTETKKHRLKLRSNSVLENKKNRYPEQSIYQHSRVHLDETQSQGYINANWVPLSPDRSLIITQGPLQHTQAQFQQMLISNNIQCVAMLCNLIQNGKTRCFDYTGDHKVHSLQGSTESLTMAEVELDNYSYTHLHYSEWPDRGVPEDMEELRRMLGELMKYDTIVIHCSAGLGRSGVVAVLLAIMVQLEISNRISIFGTARRLRQHRFGAIQNNEQYSFIYRFLSSFPK